MKVSDLKLGDYFIASFKRDHITYISIFVCAYVYGEPFTVIDLRDPRLTWTKDWNNCDWTVFKKVNNPFATETIEELLEEYKE